MTTYRQFFTAVLQGLGVPVAEGALQGLATIPHEEGRNSYFNPMNIEYNPGWNPAFKGIRDINSVHVQAYASSSAGVAASVAWFQQPRWAPQLAALKTGDYTAVVRAMAAGYTWATYQPGTQAAAAGLLNEVMAGTDTQPLSLGATPITPTTSGGLLSDLSTAQQEEVLATVRAIKASIGLTANQQQHAYNQLIQIQTVQGRLQAAQTASSGAEATQIAAVLAELKKLEAAK